MGLAGQRLRRGQGQVARGRCTKGGRIVVGNGESRPQAAAKMFNWGIRKRYLRQTPFKVESVNAITLDEEIPRNWRFNTEEDEQKLLDAANPHLRPEGEISSDSVGERLRPRWVNWVTVAKPASRGGGRALRRPECRSRW